jgi:hypothetical protein
MALDLQRLQQQQQPMKHGYSKYSMASMSTCAGDSSSESMQSYEEGVLQAHSNEQYASSQYVATTWTNQDCQPTDWNCSNTGGLQYGDDEDCYDAPFPRHDRTDMPSTRENSPEPSWNNHLDWNENYVAEQYQTYGRQMQTQPPVWDGAVQYRSNEAGQNNWAHGHQLALQQPAQLPRRSSREPPQQRGGVNPPAQQPVQTVLLVPSDQPVIFVQRDQPPNVMFPMNTGGVMPLGMQGPMPQPAQHIPSGMPPMGVQPQMTQPKPFPSDSAPSTPEPELMEPASTQQKSNGKTKNRGHLKSDSAFNKMSTEQKEALCKYIYDFMVQKQFTSQEGYLIVDVFSEVWKDMGDSEGWRVAQHRFGNLLRSAPPYFRLFRRGIRVANQCGWFARKGEKMVRLVLDKDKEKQ